MGAGFLGFESVTLHWARAWLLGTAHSGLGKGGCLRRRLRRRLRRKGWVSGGEIVLRFRMSYVYVYM